jgi:hypothetical protein
MRFDIPINVQLQKGRRRKCRLSRRRRLDQIEAFGHIERIDKGVDHVNRMALVDEITFS